MSERKVLNKYIPPNFDPSRIPKRHEKSKQHTVRLMAPFSMRCNSCGEYIYKGRKFNARKETVDGERYLGIRIFRFYIRCPQCAAEITYKTDPKSADYQCELGAKRNFEPWREEKAEEERTKTRKLLEEIHNPMFALESKTYDSKRELDIVEALDEIRGLNARLEQVDTDALFESIANEQISTTNPSLNIQPFVNNNAREEDDEIIREAFKKVQKQQETIVIPERVNTKDLLLKPSSSSSSSTLTKKVTMHSLGIVPRKSAPNTKSNDSNNNNNNNNNNSNNDKPS